MDISDQLKQMVETNVENEKRSKMMTELSAKKFDLQKSLKDTETTIGMKECELESIQNQVISLSCEMPVWKAKAEVSRKSLENLIKQVVEQDDKISQIQTDLWKNIDKWISSSSQALQKNIPFKNQKNVCCNIERKLREEKLKQIKLEGQLQAVRAYEKYQQRKLDEIKLIKDIVDNVDKLPYFS